MVWLHGRLQQSMGSSGDVAGKFFMSLINEDYTTALYVSRAARRSGLSSPLTLYAPQLLLACFVFPSLIPQFHFSVRNHCFIFGSKVWWYQLQYQFVPVFFLLLCVTIGTHSIRFCQPGVCSTVSDHLNSFCRKEVSERSILARGYKQRNGWIGVKE